MEVSTLLNQFIAASPDNADSYAQQIAHLIKSGSLSLLQFIKELGPSLTADDPTVRVYAVSCLAATLRCETLTFSKQDVAVLLQFLLAKLDDEQSTPHVLNAMVSLVRCSAFVPGANDNLKQLLSGIETRYDPRKHLAKVRHEAFVLLDAVAPHMAAYPQFVETFLHVASGEKDPRNLLVSFRLNRQISRSVAFAENSPALRDLFDVCFCYFPISFTPPPNDPYKITADELRLSLRSTIAAQLLFARDTFPSLFEKLVSTNPAVRNDVLETLVACLEQYAVPVLEQFWVTVWDALKFEILHSEPFDVAEQHPEPERRAPLLALQALLLLASRLPSPAFEDAVFNELKDNFDMGKTTRQSVVLLCCIAKTPETYNRVVEFLFSFEVWGRYIRSDASPESEPEQDVALTVTRQRDLIDNLGLLVAAYVPSLLLLRYKDHLLVFLGHLMQTSSALEKTLKCKVAQQLFRLLALEEYLTRDDVKLVLSWFRDVLDETPWLDVLVAELVAGFVRIMSRGAEAVVKRNVECVIELVLPLLLARVDDPSALGVIRQLCVNYQFLEVLSIRLLNKLAYDAYDAENYASIVECLISSFIETQLALPFLTNSWYRSFFPRFLGITVKKVRDEEVAELSGVLLGLVVRYIESSKHQDILNDMVGFFTKSEKIEEAQIEDIFSRPSLHVSLFKNILAKIDKNTTLNEDLLPRCEHAVTDNCTDFVRLNYLQTLALLNNKWGTSIIDSPNFEVTVWSLKALLVKGDHAALEHVDVLVDGLDGANGPNVSRAFAILMADLDIFSNKTKGRPVSGVANLNVRPLYKQQAFERILARLLLKYPGKKKELYLETLATLIEHVSTAILQPHLTSVFPLVLSGLATANTAVLAASLQTLKVVVYEAPQLVAAHLSSLVPALVDLATVPRSERTEKVRVAALECLIGLFSVLPLEDVVKFQHSTRRGLVAALDDKRRTVRKTAADLRQVLYELGRR